jgi:hypothetical protein
MDGASDGVDSGLPVRDALVANTCRFVLVESMLKTRTLAFPKAGAVSFFHHMKTNTVSLWGWRE